MKKRNKQSLQLQLKIINMRISWTINKTEIEIWA